MNETITAIKTKYSSRMEKVYNRLKEGQKQVANIVSDKYGSMGICMNICIDGYGMPARTAFVNRIGCNSFGLEIHVNMLSGKSGWLSVEHSLSNAQQQRIMKAIDWQTLQ